MKKAVGFLRRNHPRVLENMAFKANVRARDRQVPPAPKPPIVKT